MGIYRGAGGSGDAVNDASSEALITVQAKDAALAAQAAAEAAQAAAELAETNAETAETNAETAETNAETAATNAANSASAASTSASNAATSATNAANSATAAQTAETNAETAETNAAASASAASTSASNAATSATNASNSASAASTSATNASNSASAAATSATNAANSATAAQTAQTAAELAETNAETAEANAETAEANAAASASAAATSASNASTSASNAATSATNASNSASAAATSATNASNSASAAATSATNASNSASAAATSASNAAASYDSFDDRYLGAKSSAPTLDNDGNTLLVGALYFDTVSSSMKVWSGSAWLDAYASLSGALIAANNLSDLTNTATARTNLGVAIGTDVQAYDADTAKYDDVTANFTGTLQNGGSNVVVDSDIGVTVQAYDAQLADVAGLTPADNNFIVGNGTNFVTESGSTARTSLGLGSIATQDANNVAVTGGSINGTTVGASTPSTGSFTSLTDSGNLTFTGTGNRITGDFTNNTNASRVAFQTSTANSNTFVNVIPNGTGTRSDLRLFNSSDPDNSSSLLISNGVLGESRINSTITGTGSYLPLTIYTGGGERLRIDTSGNVGIGTSSPAQKLDVNGGASSTYLKVTGASRDAYFGQDGTGLGIIQAGNAPMYFNTNATERMRIDASGNVGIGTSSPVAPLQIGGSAPLTRYDIQGTGTLSVGFNNSGVASNNIPTGVAAVWMQQAFPLVFATNGSERMRIDSSGNVGIGTSSPGARLDVSGTIRTGRNDTVSEGGEVIWQSHTGSYTYFVDLFNGDVRNYLSSAHSQIFVTNNTERMRITSGGDLQLSTANTSILNSSGRKILNQTGGILQVISTTKTNSTSTTSTTPVDMSGMSVTITPSSTSSKILIKAALNLSISDTVKRIYMTISGGNAASYIGDAGTGQEAAVAWSPRGGDSYMMNSVPMLYLDSPATTSAITYQIRWWVEAGTGWLNRPATLDANGANQASTITVMEIAG